MIFHSCPCGRVRLALFGSVGLNKVRWVEALEKRFLHRWEELCGQSYMFQDQFGTVGGIQALPVCSAASGRGGSIWWVGCQG